MNGYSQEQLQEIQRDPRAMAQKAGWNIPDEIMGNPKAMVQHLINTGQVGGPILQRVMPMIRQMGK